MGKNNRVRNTQSKTFCFEKEDILYIQTEAKRLQKSTAKVLKEAIQMHRDVNQIVQKSEVNQNAPTECSNVIS